MNKEHLFLIRKAYSLFPKGIPDNTEEFSNSKQFQFLISRIAETKPHFIDKLQEIKTELTLKVSNLVLDDLNRFFPKDRCVKCKISLPQEKNTLLIYISMFIPYFIIYESTQDETSKSIDEYHERLHIKYEISNQYFNIVKELKGIIKNLLPDYKQMSSETFSIPIPDITFNGNGILNNFTPSRFLTPMSVFNVFFSDNYF